ncbi:MAG: hypothetical protein EHM72_09615 [Calditrichaeota bacterium]|nr:MAG: hypothetical protein EHM72_09615 [Calditrichota bacterium]
MVLLDYLRTIRRLTGTKEGCREGDCGACAVLIGELKNDAVAYKVVNSCLLPMGLAAGKHIVTIEGLTADANPIHRAFIDEHASQCGFCTPGMIIALTAYLLSAVKIKAEEAIDALDGNICRCTGYLSIKRAVAAVCADLSPKLDSNRIDDLVKAAVIPEYFKTMPKQLRSIRQPRGDQHPTDALIAGGTDLFVQQAETLETAELYFLEKMQHPVWEEDGVCFLDAAATIADLKESEFLQELFPRLGEMISLISSTPIRNKATVGGNLVNASPIGDLSILLLALDASLHLSGHVQERCIKLREFFVEYKKINLAAHEIIKSISFKTPDESVLFNFEKVSKRRHLDIAGVNSALLLRPEDGLIKEIHISAGGVAPIPLYLAQTSVFLTDKKVEPNTVMKAVQIAESEISPISDVRGSAEYKRALLGRLLQAHFIALFPDLMREVIV